jgi:S1-C subfamily serine protease
VLGYDQTHDVALIKIQNPPNNLKTVSLGDSSRLTVGQSVVAMGNAYGRGGAPAVVSGQITALDQTITASDSSGGNSETLYHLIEVNANIVPGDSGGPLMNSSNQVIGMDTAGSASTLRPRGTTGTTGGAYAIPINDAMAIVHKIESGQGSSTIQIGTRGILGVQVADSVSPAGALISATEPSSPAAAAGIAANDVIVSLNGQTVDSAASLGAAMTGHHPGDSVNVTWVDQAGRQHSAAITLIPGPPA